MFSTSHFHPMVVHFPIALILLGFGAELAFLIYKKEVCLSKMAFWLLILAAIAALAAFLTGEFFTSEMTGSAGDVQETHELFANIAIWTTVANAIFRILLKIIKKEDGGLRWISFVIFGVSAIAVSIAGLYGGYLVYSYMMPL